MKKRTNTLLWIGAAVVALGGTAFLVALRMVT